MNNSVEAIGVFGPGSGALTITHALSEMLPEKRIVHFSDVRNAPFGTKDSHAVKAFVQKGIQFLKERGCSIIILGCNSSSIHAPLLQAEENNSNLHIVSLIDITVNYYLAHGLSEPVLILGTQATVSSNIYRREIHERMPYIAIHQDTLTQLPELIDAGAPLEQIAAVIRENVMRIKKEHTLIKTVALCCTHYPIYAPLIEAACYEIFGPNVQVLQQAPALTAWAQSTQLSSPAAHTDNQSRAPIDFFLNQESSIFQKLATQLIKAPRSLSYQKTNGIH